MNFVIQATSQQNQDFDDNPTQYRIRHLLETLSIYKDNIHADFQSLFACRKSERDGNKKDVRLEIFLNKIIYHLDQFIFHDRELYNFPDFREYYLMCIGTMIGNEMVLADHDYYVFYRVVNEKQILYEFNTLMLSVFAGENTFWKFNPRTSHEPLPLICIQCLTEEVYTDTVSDFLKLMQTGKIQSDMSTRSQESIISVNNCLMPDDYIHYDNFKYTKEHCVEAHPLGFERGYNGTTDWMYDTLPNFLMTFFEQDRKSAETIVAKMRELYQFQSFDLKTSNGENRAIHQGHMLQICIPKKYAEKFAYTSFSYGYPASVYATSQSLHIAMSSFNDPPPNAIRQLSFDEIMSGGDMAMLQTRIIAHPNVFLQHGAFTHVLSASSQFNRKKFQDDLRHLLNPLILTAQAKGKRLTYSKFTNHEEQELKKHQK